MFTKSIMNSPTDSMNDDIKKYMQEKNDIELTIEKKNDLVNEINETVPVVDEETSLVDVPLSDSDDEF